MGWEPEVRRRKAAGRRPWYSLQVGGRRHHLGTDKGAAYDQAAQILAAAGVESGEPETVGGLLSAYLRTSSPRRPQGCIRFWEWAGGADPDGQSRRLVELEPGDLQRFADWLAGQKTRQQKPKGDKKPKPARALSAWSIRHYVADAAKMWAWASRQGWAICEPSRAKTRQPVLQPRDMPPTAVKDAMGRLNARAAAVVMFIGSTGCRPSEARQLRWDQIDGAMATLIGKTTLRTGRTRTLHLPPAVRDLVETQPRINEYVFNSRLRRPYTKDGLRTVLQAAGIRSSYSLRHTFAQWFLDHGGPDGGPGDKAELQVWLGHSDGRMTDVYAQVRDRRLQEVARRIKGPLGA